jgi:hypothetical protein
MGFQGLPRNRNDWYRLVQARLSEALIFQRFSVNAGQSNPMRQHHRGNGRRSGSGCRQRVSARRSHFDLTAAASLGLRAVPFGDSVTLFFLARGVPDGQGQTSYVADER